MTEWSALVREAVRIALRDGRAFVDAKVLPPRLAREVAISYLHEIGRRDEMEFQSRAVGLWLLRLDLGSSAVAVIDEPRD